MQFVMTGERESGEYECEAVTDTGSAVASFYGILSFTISIHMYGFLKKYIFMINLVINNLILIG